MRKNDNSERPKFLPSFIGAVQKEAELSGWRAVFPYAFMMCIAAGVAVASYMPESFWSEAHRELSATIYVGLLTFNGLILALGWAAFGRIYDALLRGYFGKYLMKNDLLNEYILQISYMHFVQIGAAVMAVVGLLFVLLDHIPPIVQRSIFGASLILTLYAIKQATSAVAAMNNLVWQAAYFEMHQQHPASNVVSVRERG